MSRTAVILNLSEAQLNTIQTAARVDADSLKLILDHYDQHAERLGAPTPEKLDYEDLVAIAHIGNLNDGDMCWTDFRDRVRRQQAHQNESWSIYTACCTAKAEGKLNPWLYDCGTMSKTGQGRLASAIRACTPALTRDVHDLLITSTPVAPKNLLYLQEILDSMAKVLPLFVWSVGSKETDEDWAWGPSLCLLSAFGIPALQYFARKVVNESAWQSWAFCPQRELAETIVKCHSNCGYPCGLFYLDFRQFITALTDEDIADPDSQRVHSPKAFTALLALHVLKHARLWTNRDGQIGIFVAYGGVSSFIPLDMAGLHQPFNSLVNSKALAELCRILRISYNSKGSKSWYELCASEVFRILSPRILPQPRDLNVRPRTVVAPTVEIKSDEIPNYSPDWINPGISIHNVAEVQPDETGKVNLIAVTGPDVLAYKWPFGVAIRSDVERWRSLIPATVPSRRPSEYIRKAFPNIAILGRTEEERASFSRGLNAVLDAHLAIEVSREQLIGCVVGNLLDKEYPLVFWLPYEGTFEGSTNIGKTTAAKVVAGVFEAGILTTMCHKSVSAPAQRSVAEPLIKHGTAIYDEFILPSSPDHFMSQAGLQALATGSLVTPGRAMENSVGVRLRHALYFTAKITPEVPDVQNRMIPVFMRKDVHFNPDPEEIAAALCGSLSLVIRLSLLRLLAEMDFLTKVRKLCLAPSTWRFNAHDAVTSLFGDKKDVQCFFELSMLHSRAETVEADSTGLADDIGAAPRFDPQHYFDNADPATLMLIEAKCKTGPVSPLTVVRDLLDDSGRRRVETHLSHLHLSERAAVAKFCSHLRKGPLIRPGWKIELVEDKDEKCRRRVFVHITQLTKDAIQTILEGANNDDQGKHTGKS